MNDTPLAPDVPPASTVKKRSIFAVIYRAIVGTTLIVLVVVIGYLGSIFYHEFRMLRAAQAGESSSTPIGYEGLSPKFSYAEAPDPWLQEKNGEARLWGGWDPKLGQIWFRFNPGDLSELKLSRPIYWGKDGVRAIDYPVVEREGEPRWSKVHSDDEVAVLDLNGVSSIYPLMVLERVLIVNDQIDRDRSVLVVRAPREEVERTIRVYDPVVEGSRVTFGTTGYIYDRHILLYDRQTESLWTAGDESLESVAGPRKGVKQKLLARLEPISWTRCAAERREGRLIVGDKRNRPTPKE